MKKQCAGKTQEGKPCQKTAVFCGYCIAHIPKNCTFVWKRKNGNRSKTKRN